MTKELTDVFVGYIARCLTQASNADSEKVEKLVGRVLGQRKDFQPDRDFLQRLQDDITELLGEHDRIDLVSGGATKIKGYVFEAPKLPEIRGASTLLDWVNEVELPKLWGVELPELWGADNPTQWYEKGIIYAGGGSFLALAPFGAGKDRARQIERAYTTCTLTANSVAAARSFRLIELRYGRDPLGYWIEQFEETWERADQETRRQLTDYYYGQDDDELRVRFFRRKTFGELVTLLAGDVSRRRDERALDEGPAVFPRQPWDERCDSSDLRPSVSQITIDDGIYHLSEASARKVIAGRLVKEISIDKAKKLLQQIVWKPPRFKDWKGGLNQRWVAHLDRHRDMEYAKSLLELNPHYFDERPREDFIRPSHDVHEIGAPSNRYIAMIYADGNNVGRLMATLATPQAYASVSEALTRTMERAVFEGLARWLKPLKNPRRLPEQEDPFQYVHPFEILSIGGDDMLLVVPGAHALDIVLTIAQSFERQIIDEFDQLSKVFDPPVSSSFGERSRYQRDLHPQSLQDAQDERIAALRRVKPYLGLSAGVVVAPENTPIFFMNNLVEELLKSAKKKASLHAKGSFPTAKLPPDATDKKRYYGGAVDFMVLKSITMVTDKIAEFRTAALEHDAGHEQRRLYARPYAWHELAGLLRTVRELKQAGLPRSQLYRLGDTLEAALHGGLNPSVLEYLFARTRMRREHSDALAQHVEHAWHAPGEDAIRLPPWMQHKEEKKGREPAIQLLRETIWLDMLEIYDLLEADKEPADGQD